MVAADGTTEMIGNETWRPIPWWEGLYSVSDMGRVKSEARAVDRPNGPMRVREKVLTLRMGSDSRQRVALHRGNVRSDIPVHRLVLLAFVGPCPDGMECCHWDDDPQNNRLSNLRWATRSDNTYDRIRNGRHHSARKTHCPRGHALVGRNVVAGEATRGKRGCRSCANARSYIVHHPELSEDFKRVSDSYYRGYASAA